MDRAARLLVHGAGGRIGQLLLPLVLADPRWQLVAALVRRESALTGQPVAGSTLRYSTDWPASVDAVDVVVDFALPAAFDALLDQVQQRGCALVSGTTGLSDDQRKRLRECAQHAPLLWASNFSLGAAVLAELVRRATELLPESFDVAVFESHHSGKRDAPSGTALTLAAAAARDPAHVPSICSLRAGQIVGEHEVYFAGPAERIELVHRAADRSVFARGALSAARWLMGRGPGEYQVRDVVLHR
jgi:4-hydroxy-tetrahydrodipicolinate reductase